MIIGRSQEIKLLSDLYNRPKSSIAVLYGRRRIGKSFLVDEHLTNRPHFKFEGIENQSAAYQIQLLATSLFKELSLPNVPSSIKTWEELLELLTKYIKAQGKKKVIIFFDEYQWMTAGRSKLTSLLKKYWDNDWKKYRLQLILCGSVSSYMLQSVIRSKALYGRIDAELNIEQLPPDDTSKFFKVNRSSIEILKYLLVLGGVPKYLNEINQSLSFEQNINYFFFQKNSPYLDEYQKVFYSQFKEHRVYERIVSLLAVTPLTLEEVGRKLKIASGGGLKFYLENLEKAQFIKSYHSSPDNQKSKLISYRLVDPLLRFYLTFVAPNLKLIASSNQSSKLFERITKGKLSSFLGIAFDNFCHLFGTTIAEKMGFEEEVLSFGPMLSKLKDGFQVDLVYFRTGKNITLCELKFSEEVISPKIIPEVETRVSKLQANYPNHSIQKALITTVGQSKSLQAAEYFDYFLNANLIVGQERLKSRTQSRISMIKSSK